MGGGRLWLKLLPQQIHEVILCAVGYRVADVTNWNVISTLRNLWGNRKSKVVGHDNWGCTHLFGGFRTGSHECKDCISEKCLFYRSYYCIKNSIGIVGKNKKLCVLLWQQVSGMSINEQVKIISLVVSIFRSQIHQQSTGLRSGTVSMFILHCTKFPPLHMSGWCFVT